MKQVIFSLCLILILAVCKSNVEEPEMVSPDDVVPFDASQIDAHNSRNSLDWEGSYSGVLPCEECVGIETFLTINLDHSYTVTQRYVKEEDAQAEEITREGKFYWNEDGSAITLDNIEGEISTFRVNELYLTPLRDNGLEIQPETGNNFKLLKQ